MKRRSCHERGVCNGRSGPGCTCQHDTETLPPGAFYFAPGAIESAPSRKRLSGWRSLVRDALVLLAIAGILGGLAGFLQAKGWPL